MLMYVLHIVDDGSMGPAWALDIWGGIMDVIPFSIKESISHLLYHYYHHIVFTHHVQVNHVIMLHIKYMLTLFSSNSYRS